MDRLLTDEQAPGWFREAVARQALEFAVQSGGVCLHYRCWNPTETNKPPLLFVHGMRAHSRWWDFIAPLFVEEFRVFAMDLSGMGESGHRVGYSLETHTDDLRAVIAHARIAPVTAVGHSFGGTRVLRLCADSPEMVARAIVLDSPVRLPETQLPHVYTGKGKRALFPDAATALSRYRLLPAQNAEAYLLDYVARHSIKEVEGGWSWKFDPKLVNGVPEPDGKALLERIRVPVDYVYGELSAVVDEQQARRVAELLRQGRNPVVIEGAAHHMMLDQPLATIDVLRTLLAIGR